MRVLIFFIFFLSYCEAPLPNSDISLCRPSSCCWQMCLHFLISTFCMLCYILSTYMPNFKAVSAWVNRKIKPVTVKSSFNFCVIAGSCGPLWLVSLLKSVVTKSMVVTRVFGNCRKNKKYIFYMYNRIQVTITITICAHFALIGKFVLGIHSSSVAINVNSSTRIC